MKSLFTSELSASQPLTTGLLTCAITSGRLANSYLLTGSNLTDKRKLAVELACILNCLNITGDTTNICHQKSKDSNTYCQNCRLICQAKHPQAFLELLSLDPQNPNSKIPVEKARELAFELSKTSSFFRIIWITDARQDVFHRPSANSLLKTIEEPKSRCLFLLPASSKEQVLPTIVSRSQEIPLVQAQSSLLNADTPPPTKETSEWAKLPFFQWAKSQGPQSFSARGEALEVSNLLYSFMSKQNEESLDEADPIDRLVLIELSIIGSSAIDDPILSRYLTNLQALVQSLRTRLARHVSLKASLDNFFIDWLNLRGQVSGNSI